MGRKSKSKSEIESRPEPIRAEPAGSTSPAGSEPARAVPKRKRRRTKAAFELAHPNAAGIDIGSASHFVAVPEDRDDKPVREFKSFTEDLERLADWLTACGVDTVAMESTGVYWIPLFELLEQRGFKVFLVNALAT